MPETLLILAGSTCLVWCLFALDVWLGNRLMVSLEDIQPAEAGAGATPLVSIVIPARNEESSVAKALESVLELDYPNLEILVVDDRSEDGTGEILDRVAEGDARVRILHLTELPAGWLGKNHALQTGGLAASGRFLLFTDADVILHPTALTRAMHLVEERDLDHLTAACDIDTSSLPLELFVATFALFFNGYYRPWRVNDPKSRRSAGIGAFNLVRTTAWHRAGTHEAIARAADDDMRLGRLLRASGARQLFTIAGGLVHVEWYPTVRAAVRGLEKNALAAIDYSYTLLIAGALAQLVLTAWPFAAILLTTGVTRLVNLGAVVFIIASHLTLVRKTNLRAWTALGLPLGTLMFVFTILRAGWLAKWRGGVYWRRTFYPLDELKRR